MRNKLFLVSILLSIPLCIGLLWFANVRRHWSDDSYKDRIWLHRTNSPEKLLEFADEYSGFECDIILRGDSLIEVTHDEPVSYGISIERFFPLLQGNERRMWFDFKNLNSQNTLIALAFFETGCKSYGIDKKRLIIEGSDLVALKQFREAGFYTAYYVRMGNNPDLNKIIRSGAIDALSFYARDYESVENQVTEPIDWLVWEHHHRKEALSVLPRGRKLLQDNRVKIILVKDKGHHHL